MGHQEERDPKIGMKYAEPSDPGENAPSEKTEGYSYAPDQRDRHGALLSSPSL